MRGLGKLKTGFVAGDRNVAKRRERATESHSAALHDADDRRSRITERAVEIEDRLTAVAYRIGFENRRGLPHRFPAQTKIFTCAFEQDQPRTLSRTVKHLRDLRPGSVGLPVAGFGPVQCDGRDVAIFLHEHWIRHVNLLTFARIDFRRAARGLSTMVHTSLRPEQITRA